MTDIYSNLLKDDPKRKNFRSSLFFSPKIFQWGIFVKASELLNAALDYGMIDLAEIREACEMKRRTDILAKHPYKITQAKDGQWTTHYYDGGKRKQIKRKFFFLLSGVRD